MLLDTTVCLDTLDGSATPEVDAVLAGRPLYHVSVVLAELTDWLGSLSPRGAGTASALKEFADVINNIPPYRVEGITPGVMLEAGILSGLVYCMGGFQPHQMPHAVNDAAIYLHALKNGHTVLTRNIRDFDVMQQSCPPGACFSTGPDAAPDTPVVGSAAARR